jgi:Lon protease-like protein
MIGRCMREGTSFGVLQVESGGEVGAVDALAEIGTAARIVDFEQLPGGLLGVLSRGTQRFRLLQRTTQADGLHIGEVEWLADTTEPLPEEHAPLVTVLRRVLPKLGSLQAHLQPDYEDSAWVSYRLADLLPLTRPAQQRLLALDSARDRLAILAPMIRTDFAT